MDGIRVHFAVHPARRGVFTGLLCAVAFLCDLPIAWAESDGILLFSKNGFHVDDPIADTIDWDPASRQDMIEESLKTSRGEVPHLHAPKTADAPPMVPAPTGGRGQPQDDQASQQQDEDSDVSKLAEKINELEQEMSGLRKALGYAEEATGNKRIVQNGIGNSTMKITGRIHVDGWGYDTDDDPAINQFNGGDDPQNRLGFRRLRFALQGQVRDNMVYKLEVETSGAPDIGFRDMYIGWIDLPFFQEVLLGNQKRPLGLDHLNSSRFNVFMERPFAIEAFNEDSRRLGLQSLGVSDDLSWNWRYSLSNQRNIQDEANYLGDHLQLQLAGRLANTFWYDHTSDGRGYGHWAISGSHADVSENAVRGSEARFRTRPEARTGSMRWLDTGKIAGADYYNLMGLEGVLNFGALQLVGEYQCNWVQRDGFQDVRFDGGYLYASYFLTGEHLPWDRESGTLDRVVPFENFWLVDLAGGQRAAGWGALQIAARYSQADLSDEDIFGGQGEGFTFGMNWYWNANAKMQFNYVTGEISNSTVGNRGAAPVSGDYDIYGVRFMVDF